LANLRSGLALLASGDVAVQAASLAGGLEDRFKKVAKSMPLNWPVTPKDLLRASYTNKSQESKDCELASQGHGVEDFRNKPLGDCWLYDPTVLSSSRYTDALRLKTNTFGVNFALGRAEKGLPVDCRRCKEKPENLGHVLGEYVAGEGMRI
jgi:hypothetical protein